MANIALRSPRFITSYNASAASATLSLLVGGILRYSLSKPTVLGRATFDISEMSRDFLSPTYSYTNQSVALYGTITLYNSGGSPIIAEVFSDQGYDGYTYFSGGASVFGISTNDLGSGLAQSNTVMYVPEGETPKIPSFDLGYTASYSGVTVVSICEPKYTPVKISFINRFGFLQDIWFFKKSARTISGVAETYRATINDSSGNFSTSNRQFGILSKNGKEIITANTGYVSEGLNVAVEELMMSELVWATISGTTYPVNVTSNSLGFKTSVNDKLVDYTIEFEFAFDKVNNVR